MYAEIVACTLSKTRHIKTFDKIEIQLNTLTHNVSYSYEHVQCGQIIMFITKHYITCMVSLVFQQRVETNVNTTVFRVR